MSHPSAWLVAGVLLLAAAPLAAGDHPQTSDEATIRFDHRGGNAWWVEVKVDFATAEPGSVHLDRIDARDQDGPWTTLTLRSWGNYAGSFHVEPGHQVQFRGAQHGGMSDARIWESCWFTHPAGVEQCGTQPAEFDATFSGVKGNAWWIQASVSAVNGQVAKVEASIDGGAFKPLSNKGWGWAASYHAPEGSLVQLRATSTTGATDESGCYRWTSAAPTGCEGSPVGQFEATFSNARGNAWWIETDVHVRDGTLDGVDARVDGGSWVALTKQSWGSWAKSIPAPAGSTVEFRARATDTYGQPQEAISGTYAWPPQ